MSLKKTERHLRLIDDLEIDSKSVFDHFLK